MLYSLKNISLVYKDGQNYVHALDDVSLELPEKGLVVLFGPSGSGKTSLLYILSGIRKPTSGAVEYRGQPLNTSSSARLTQMGYVFQSSYLIGHLKVWENVALGFPDNVSEEGVDKVLNQVNLLCLKDRFPDQLSGGQSRRVSIARALINNPKVIFADEPTAFLDHENGSQIVNILKEISKTSLVVLVTHDSSIVDCADKVITLRDGKVVG